MTKPTPEEFGCINNIFPTVFDRHLYEKAKRLYLSWKRKNNKRQLVENIIHMIQDNPKEYSEIIYECLYKSFNQRTQKDLKTWVI